MTFEETIGAIFEAKLAPLHSEIARLSAEVEAVRRALPPMLVPLKEAARLMRVSYATARRRVDAGEWPARRDGGRILVDLAALHPKSEEEIAQLARELGNPARRASHNGQA